MKAQKGFRDRIPRILSQFAEVVPTIAKGILELHQEQVVDANTKRQIHYFLDRFYTSRISIRMLLHQHVLLFTGKPKQINSKSIGCIEANCDITMALLDAYDDAKVLCEKNYGYTPEMKIRVHKEGQEMSNNTPVTTVYVPAHIHHILFEVLKNALKATMDNCLMKSGGDGEVLE